VVEGLPCDCAILCAREGLKALHYRFQNLRETGFEISHAPRVQSQLSAVDLQYSRFPMGGLITLEFIEYLLDSFEFREAYVHGECQPDYAVAEFFGAQKFEIGKACDSLIPPSPKPDFLPLNNRRPSVTREKDYGNGTGFELSESGRLGCAGINGGSGFRRQFAETVRIANSEIV